MSRGSTFSMLYSRTTGAVINATNDEAEWQNILNNLDPSGIGSYFANATEMQTASNPAPGGTPSIPTNLLGWMEQVHYQLSNLTGNSYWYQATPLNLTNAASKADVQSGTFTYAADTGSADAYVVTLAPVPTWATGLRFYTKITHANVTATPTINPNGLGAKTIVRPDGSAVYAGDLPLNWMAQFEYYDATHAALLNPQNVSSANVIGQFQAPSLTAVLGTRDNTPTLNAAHQAATDLFVTAWGSVTGGTGAGSLTLTSDGSNPPTTVIDLASDSDVSTDRAINVHGVVRKGDYYKVATSGTLTGTTISVVPLGS